MSRLMIVPTETPAHGTPSKGTLVALGRLLDEMTKRRWAAEDVDPILLGA
jgi:hypothetical protein